MGKWGKEGRDGKGRVCCRSGNYHPIDGDAWYVYYGVFSAGMKMLNDFRYWMFRDV
jgi:hypothetical protein